MTLFFVHGQFLPQSNRRVPEKIFACSEAVESFSAGVFSPGLDPRAVQVMAEANLDIKEQSYIGLQDQQGLCCAYHPVRSGQRKLFPTFPGVLHGCIKAFEQSIGFFRLRTKHTVLAFLLGSVQGLVCPVYQLINRFPFA